MPGVADAGAKWDGVRPPELAMPSVVPPTLFDRPRLPLGDFGFKEGNMFGPMLREQRHARGLTLLAVGKKLGTSKGYLSGIENEKTNPPSDRKVRRLAKILGMDELNLLKVAWLDRMPADVRALFAGK